MYSFIAIINYYFIVFNSYFISSLSTYYPLYLIIHSFLLILILLFKVENINIVSNLLYNLMKRHFLPRFANTFRKNYNYFKIKRERERKIILAISRVIIMSLKKVTAFCSCR